MDNRRAARRMDQQRTKVGEGEDLRDLNKKYHLQVSERRIYSRPLLLDTQCDERVALIDQLAERVRVLGG